MSHLTLETLARLVDESPEPTEAEHLDLCEQCHAELELLRADAAALRHIADPQPPIGAWLALEQTLQREGLLRKTSWMTHALRMAAVFTIFVLGSIVGGLAMRQPRVAPVATTTPAVTTPVRIAEQPLNYDSQLVIPQVPRISQIPQSTQPSAPPAATAEEAAARLREAERAYLTALGRFSDFSSPADETDPVARLAALESIVATTRAALGQAPADPVINGYHLTAVAQRDATLRQLSNTRQTWY